ncbi:hypothetical protein BKA67DRAFT_657880 [Truncatella angustata]|uniref:Zn(2)-C6 fungal-type domain-containing protein n=1 Tax=Truncatella angustata TaxID=152316 RepID=A0A9P8ZZA3_9PEZI|nr:uncharacterized protein BKA67DRAFT_657880 [Truncatella angustata]KAH6655987.1 hypothetical protein BKA67DRAFT_657880 [Truncatella angustata]KAH8201001.1 hypothetical protein TruAng_004860 [Truncatella angustata]
MAELAPTPATRKRQSAPKGRNGCRRCKVSHVRCSEDRPNCSRCLRLDIPCFYVPSRREREQALALAPVRGIRPKPSNDGVSPGSIDSREADYYFHRFVAHVAPARNMETMGSCLDFWLRTVPRESASNEGVRYFTMALGAMDLAMHQLRVKSQPRKSVEYLSAEYRAALRYYNIALQRVRTELADQEHRMQLRTFLIYCMLQTLFEGLQGNLEAFRKVSHMGFEILKHRIMQDELPIAASVDDQGIEEAKVYLSRMVVVMCLMGPAANHLEMAKIKIVIPIRVSMPDRHASASESCRLFNDFYSRAVTWILDVVSSLSTGVCTMAHFSGEFVTVIGQLQEWGTCLESLAGIATHPTDCTRLIVHQLDAKFGVVFLQCFLHGCSWDLYREDCLDILKIARHAVQAVVETPEGYGFVRQALLKEKLNPILTRLIENCQDHEVRRQGLDMMIQISDVADYPISQASSFLIANCTPGGVDGETIQLGDTYMAVGYTWDRERNLFKVKLGRSTGATADVTKFEGQTGHAV